MTAEKMPMMLDDPMAVDLNDVDDLFGDTVGLSLPVRPDNKNLLLRTDDLRRRGCSQAVAWSKSGSVASLTRDGQTLELRYLRCKPQDGSWDMSEPTICEHVKGSPAVPLVHLEWGTTISPELAVVDAAGRVTIVSFSIALNNPYVTRKWDADPIDDTQAVVGAHWLAVAPQNQQKPYNVLYGPATKHGVVYQYESSFVHAVGPSHPHATKSALVCITMSGLIKLFWSQNNNKMEETTKELESVNVFGHSVTHAAVASDKKFLLVAVATSSGQLELIKVEIQWGGSAQAEKSTLPQNSRLNPSIIDKHLATTSWLQSRTNDPGDDATVAELSQLHVLPSILDGTGKNTAPPVIVAVRSRAADGAYQAAQTILDRWEATDQRQNVPPAFAQLGSRRNSVPSELPTAMNLRKLQPIVLDKVLIGFQIVQFGKSLLLTFADGSVEYRDRFTFEELYTTEETDKVMNLRQVGWTFTDNGPCHQIALSPTHCSMIQMGDDGEIRWSKLHYPAGDFGDSMQEAHYAASIAGLTVTAASAMWYQSNYDDMLAIVKPFSTKKRFTHDWVNELVRILKVPVDYAEETTHESLARNTILQACLSIMNALGFRGEGEPRSFMSKFAMVELNVRNIAILITLASNTPNAVKDRLTPLDEHEVVDALTGCVRWGQALIAWLTDSLFELMNDDRFMECMEPRKYSEMTPYLIEKNEVSLHLILSSSGRALLSAMCKRIMYLENMSFRAIEWYRNNMNPTDQKAPVKLQNMQLHYAYQRMQQVTSSSIVRVKEFEHLLSSVGGDIRLLYQSFLPTLVKKQANAPQGKQMDIAMKSAQGQFELQMMTGMAPPPPFLQVIRKLFSKDVPAFRNQTDPARLFFADFDLLEVTDDPRSLTDRARRGAHVDVFSRAVLKRSAASQWRRCTRCAAVMEDMFGNRAGLTFMLNQQRKCACGGYWGLLPKGELLI